MSFDSLVSGFEALSRSVVQGIENQGNVEVLWKELNQHPELGQRVQAVWERFAAEPQASRIEKIRTVERMVDLMPFSPADKTRALSLRSWSYLSVPEQLRALGELCQAEVLPASTKEILDRVYTGEVRNRVHIPALVKRAVEKGHWEIYDYFAPRMTEGQKREMAIGIRDTFLNGPKDQRITAALQRFDRMFPDMNLIRSAWERADLDKSMELLDIAQGGLEGPIWVDCVIRSRFLSNGAVFEALQAKRETSEGLQEHVSKMDSYGRNLAMKAYIPPVEEAASAISLEFED